MGAGDKIHMPRDAQLGGLQSPQVIHTDGFNLLAVGALLVELEQFLRFAAAGRNVDGIVWRQIFRPEHAVLLIIADVGQFFIVVGLLVQRLLHQLPGQDIGAGTLVIPAVGQIDIGLPHGRHRNTFPDIASGRAESIPHGYPGASGIRNTHIFAQLGQFLLVH